MTEAAIAWPEKTLEIQNRHVDSTRWNEFDLREGDVVIASFGKSGTTWVQQIAAQLIFAGQEGVMATAISPWFELRLIPYDMLLKILGEQQHRRVIKTHLPVGALALSPKAKYIYVARDARDIVWSAFNHITGFTDAALDQFNTQDVEAEHIARPEGDEHQFYLDFVAGDGTLMEFGAGEPLWAHVQGWWDIQNLPNVLLVHYANLRADLEGEVRRIARFLDIDSDASLIAKVAEHSGIDHMRDAAKADAHEESIFKRLFKNGADTFFNKGTNGRWKDVLSADEIARCDEVAARHLTSDCAHWLKTGELAG